MNPAGQDHDRLKEGVYALVDACLADTITPAEEARLYELICTDAAAQGHYVRFVLGSLDLAYWSRRYLHDDDAQTPAAPHGIDLEFLARLEKAEASDGNRLRPGKTGSARPAYAAEGAPSAPQRWPAKVAAGMRGLVRDFVQQPLAAALLLLSLVSGAVLFWQLSQHTQPPADSPQAAKNDAVSSAASATKPTSRPAMARLTRTSNAKWGANAIQNGTSQQPPATGTMLAAGDRLKLDRGLAEIAFETGAAIILEGPAELVIGDEESGIRIQEPESEIQNPKSKIQNACFLNLGKLVARVPKQAHGFTVQTPTMKIVDLGTEFAVSVQSLHPATDPAAPILQPASSSSTEVHVLRGEVEVISALVATQAPQSPQSKIQNPKSKILKSGEAIIGGPAGKNPRRVQAEPAKFVRELPVAKLTAVEEPGASALRLMAGDILAVSRNTLKLVKIDPRTGKQTVLAQGNPDLHGREWMCVAVDGQGSVLVGADRAGGGTGGSLVLRIDPRDGAIRVLASDGLLSHGRINGLTVAADGGIYGTLDGAKDEIFRIDPQTGAASTVVAFGSSVWGIATDMGGRDLLVNAYGDGAVVQIKDRTLNTWVQSSQVPGGPWGVAVRPDGRVFVSATSSTQGTIVEVDRATHRVTEVVSIPKEHDWMLGTLAVEPDGRLIVCKYDAESSVYRIDVDARTVVPVAVGGHLQRVMGVAVVPAAPATAREGTR